MKQMTFRTNRNEGLLLELAQRLFAVGFSRDRRVHAHGDRTEIHVRVRALDMLCHVAHIIYHMSVTKRNNLSQNKIT